MMFRDDRQLQTRWRGAAWLIALLFLWMGTGGVLHHDHDDDAGPVTSKAALGLLSQSVPVSPCAACEWTQALQSSTPILCRIAAPTTLSQPRAIRPVFPVLSRLPLRRLLRAPPQA